jgi:hypothetical protein
MARRLRSRSLRTSPLVWSLCRNCLRPRHLVADLPPNRGPMGRPHLLPLRRRPPGLQRHQVLRLFQRQARRCHPRPGPLRPRRRPPVPQRHQVRRLCEGSHPHCRSRPRLPPSRSDRRPGRPYGSRTRSRPHEPRRLPQLLSRHRSGSPCVLPRQVPSCAGLRHHPSSPPRRYPQSLGLGLLPWSPQPLPCLPQHRCRWCSVSTSMRCLRRPGCPRGQRRSSALRLPLRLGRPPPPVRSCSGRTSRRPAKGADRQASRRGRSPRWCPSRHHPWLRTSARWDRSRYDSMTTEGR